MEKIKHMVLEKTDTRAKNAGKGRQLSKTVKRKDGEKLGRLSSETEGGNMVEYIFKYSLSTELINNVTIKVSIKAAVFNCHCFLFLVVWL